MTCEHIHVELVDEISEIGYDNCMIMHERYKCLKCGLLGNKMYMVPSRIDWSEEE